MDKGAKKERNEQMNYQFPCSFSQVGKTQSLLEKKVYFLGDSSFVNFPGDRQPN